MQNNHNVHVEIDVELHVKILTFVYGNIRF